MERHKQAIKLLIIVIALAGIIISIGYSSRRKPATNRFTFARTTVRLERGRYIVEGLAHCFQCHSEVDWKNPGAQPKPGKKAGGTIFVEDGMDWLIAPNISPDVETGAGSWTDEQFARAIREGIGHDGRRLFPMMPYMNFRSMSDEDLASVVVYVRSVDPVRNALPKTTLPEVVKGSLPPHQPIVARVAGPDMSDPIARGKYLVTLGNCMMCHTPMKQGQPIAQLAFGGGLKFTGPWG
ncbi:MAG TPA: c-type cytochrome, partial [Pyrinomonadaceae bacterium]|nr:c-type cytochrome [Pyrinomonadaceae bacterium]